MSADTSKNKYLEFIQKAATADSESDIDNLFTVFTPEGKSRSQMGEVYEDVLGYNPITHFDVEELSGVIASILDDADPDFISAIKPKRNALISRAMEIFDTERTETLKKCLAMAGKELLSEDLGRALSKTLLGHDLEAEERDNDFEGFEDDDDESLSDTMRDMEDDSGLGTSDLDDEMDGFEFDDDEED